MVPAAENISNHDACKPILRFITIEGEPSKACNDEAIRKLIRTNARRSGHRGKTPRAESPAPLIAPAPDPTRGVASQIPGRTRFALLSRKPMKRVRRRVPVGSPSNDIEEDTLQVIPISLPFAETASNWVPPKAKPNIGRMLQHRKSATLN